MERICDFKEMRTDPRITYKEFKNLIAKALKMRSRKKHIELLFKIMDQDNSGQIHAHDLYRVSSQVQDKPLDMEEARNIIINCSESSRFITKNEFMHIIKRAK